MAYTRQGLMTISRTARIGLAVVLGVGLGACDSVLDVHDPDIIVDAGSAAGAIALRNGASPQAAIPMRRLKK